MTKRIIGLLAFLTICVFGSAQVFITEIADPNDNTACRFVELYNAGPTAVDLSSGWEIIRYTNGNNGNPGDAPSSSVALTGTVPAGGFYLIASNMASFNGCYGFNPDQAIGTGGPADSNGDDQIGLVDNMGNVVDFFGVIGEDGSGTCHEFEDGRVERDASVTSGNSGTWDESNWNEWSDSSPAGCTNYNGSTAVNVTDGIFDPGAWIGASVTCAIDVIADGGNQTACDPLTDTFSNDVTITYSNAPTTGTLDVNGQSFAIGTSPQTVTLTGLAADGMAVDVTAVFSDDGACTLTESALFMAPSSCFGDSEPPVLEVCSTENADAAAYDDGWDNSEMTAAGFANWSLSSSGANSGHFANASSTLNGDGDSNGDGDIDTGGEALGLFANSGESSQASLAFAESMDVGSTLSFNMDNGWIESGGSVGFLLSNDVGEALMNFDFVNGAANYQFTSAAGVNATSLGFTDEGLEIEITITAANTFDISVTALDGGANWTATGANFMAQPGGQVPSILVLSNTNAGFDQERNAYFNAFEICHSCPADVAVDCADYTNLAVTGQPTATDDTDPAPSVTFSDVIGSCAGGTFTVTRTWTATDAAGNSSSCDQILTVTDNTDPVAVCQDFTLNLDASGNGTLTTADIDNGSFDGCLGVELSIDITAFDCDDVALSPVLVTMTATDSCGNTNTCSSNITVVGSVACLDLPDLVITEIMYNTSSTDDEWIEICNNEGADVDISGYVILDDANTAFTFPAGTTLLNGDCITISLGSNGDGVYNPGCPFTPDFGVDAVTNSTNVLSNGAGTITLTDGTNTVDIVSYDDADGADGNDNSLHVTDITMDNSLTSANWQEVTLGGSPGGNFLTSNCAPTNTFVEFTSVITLLDEAAGTISVCVGITNPDPVNQTDAVVQINSSSTALNGTDYDDGAGNAVASPIILSWPGGDATDKCVTINIIDDVDIEGQENIILDLGFPFGGNNVQLGTNVQHTVIVNDNDVPPAVPCGDLFISEYVEGSSNNKCLEVYNPSAAPIDMGAGGYALYKYNNGSLIPTDTLYLMGMLNPGEVYVVCTDASSAEFTAEADQLLAFPSVAHFNGNDAVQLVSGASTSSFGISLDVIGQIGVDPGTEWTGSGCSTLDMTLVRNATIDVGDADGSDAFDPSLEWTCLPQNTVTDLGGHISDCIVSTCLIDSITDGGNQTVCDPVTNTYTHDVVIHYSNPPAFGNLEVNGQVFMITASPQTVTLTGLIADSNPVDVSAVFSADATCTLDSLALFTAPSNCLPPNTIVINELDYDQPSNDTEEFLELYNNGTSAVDLDPYEVVLVNGNGNSIYETIPLPAVTLNPGDYYVICFGPNSSAYCDQSVATAPQNGPDAVGLLNNGNLVDALSYEGPVTGYVEGTAAGSDGAENSLSRIPNGSDTDDNSVDFVSTCITPGEANVICPENEECADAFTAPVVEFGSASSPYMTGTVCNASPNPVCSGIGDEVVWYRFVAQNANDVIQAGVHPALTPGYPTGFDAVIEVWDACAGNSLGCFDNYGADQLERAMPGNLIAGNTYYYSVHTAGGAGSTSSCEFSTIVRTFHDSRLRGTFCGATNLQLNDVIQSDRDDLNELYSHPAIQVPGYGFQFCQGSTVIATVDHPDYIGFYMPLAEVASLMAYGQTYDVKVRHQVIVPANNTLMPVWSDYGTPCTISFGMPPTTNLLSSYCAQGQNYYLQQQVLAEPIYGATQYRFTFDDGANPPIIHVDGNYAVNLWQVDGLEYGRTYEVTVEANLPGVGFTTPGTSCTLEMQPKPESTQAQMTFCNMMYNAPSGEIVQANYVFGASAYQWRYTPIGGGAPVEFVTSTFQHNFSSGNGYQWIEGVETYNVEVRAFAGGVWGDFSGSCPIMINYTPQPEIEQEDSFTQKDLFEEHIDFSIFPNPSQGDEFRLDVNTDMDASSFNVSIMDITGKTVFSKLISSNGDNTSVMIRFADALESGIYLLRVQSDGQEGVKKFVVE